MSDFNPVTYLREKLAGAKVTDPALLAQLAAAGWNTPPTTHEWQTAPEVQAGPKWAAAPEVSGPWATPPTAQERGKVTDPALLAQLEGRAFDPDRYLAEKRALSMSGGEAFTHGATRGAADRILSRVDALAAQQGRGDPNNPLQSLDAITDRPVDEARFQADSASNLQDRRRLGAAVEQAHPLAYGAGAVAPAVASMAIPGGATVKGATAIGGALGLLGSESDDPVQLAKEVAINGVVSGAGTKLLQLLGRGVSAVGDRILPKAEAIKDAIAQKIADRSASAADALAKSAQGTAGATRANASRAIERLGMTDALPATEQAANAAALAAPEAQDLATQLATRARSELPGKLAQVQSADALVGQTAADAAAARSPEAVAAMEQQMRSETAKRLLTRYILPAAGGYAAGEMAGGHGGVGAIAGFGSRPMLRALLRGAASPGFTAPISRAGVDLAQLLANAGTEGGGRAATLLDAILAQAKGNQ